MAATVSQVPASSNLPEPCEHKADTGCMLTALPCCCSCADKRPHATAYPVYIDGQGMQMKGRRWQRYCRRCYDHWQSLNQNAESSGPPQISNVPIHESPTSIPPATLVSNATLPTRFRTGDQPSFHNASTNGHNHPRPRRHRLFPLGTREDVQREDYESPIFGMFSRAWTRYRDAEEVRTAARLVDEQDDVDTIVHNAHMLDLDNTAEERQSAIGPQRYRPIVSRRRNFHSQFYGLLGFEQPSRLYPHEAASEGNGSGGNLIDQQQRPEPKSPEDLKVDLGCKVCREQRIDTIMMPCMHAATCHWCAELWKSGARDQTGRFNGSLWTCVVCRKQVKEQRRFYI